MNTVLITGTSRGLGLELARQYAVDGWRVFACARTTSAGLAHLASGFPAMTIHALDVDDHARIEELAREITPAIDVLLNNAGILGRRGFDAGGARDQAFGHSDFGEWEHTFRINVAAPMKMAEAFVGHVARSRQKKIVTMSSMLGSMALNDSGGLYGYRASKAAVNAIMRSMAIDLADRGIIAAALHPGWVRTEMGGRNAALDVVSSVKGLREVIAGLSPADAGRLIAYDGSVLPW